MLVTDVHTVHPGAVQAVGLGIFALMVLQIAVSMYIVHEAGLVIFAGKAELAVLHLLVGGDIECIVSITITVHVILQHVGVVISASPSLVDEAVVVVALVMSCESGNEAVGSGVDGIVKIDVVGSTDSGHIGECRLSIGTRHAGELLLHAVGVGCHEAHEVPGTHLHGQVGTPAISFVGVLQYECLLVAGCAECLGIDGTGVCSIPSGVTLGVCHAPVGDGNVIDHLVDYTLCCNGEGEVHGQLIVHGQGCLPYLRHLELRVHGRDA